MPVESTHNLASTHAEDVGIHSAVIEQRIPRWLVEATTAQRQGYFQALQRQATAIQAIAPVFTRAGSIIDFAAGRLTQALEQRFSLRLDVNKVELVRFETIQTFPVQRERAHRQSLLQAALANFSENEALPGSWEGRGWVAPVGATVASPAKPLQAGQGVWQIHKEDILAVPVEAFVDCCRTLDIGAQYQAHLRQVFAMHEPTAAPAVAMREHVQAGLQVQVQAAWLKGDISPEAQRMLVGMLDAPSAPLRWGAQGAQLCWLEMLASLFHGGHAISGAFVVVRADGLGCVVYLPGDPLHPLKEYADLSVFAAELRGRLRNAQFRRSFVRNVGLKRLEIFEARLLEVLGAGGASQDLATSDSVAALGMSAVPVERPVVEMLHFQAMVRIAEDARFHAVPAADCDHKARDERLARLRGLGVNVLNLLGLFIPALGAVMGVYGAIGLLEDVFEGVDDWTHGQTTAAIEHLQSITEGLATGAVLGKLAHVDFIDALVPVAAAGSRERLWRPDVWKYRSALSLPASTVPDEIGIMRHEGQAFIRLNQALHAVVEPAANAGPWRLQPPRKGGYAVPLVHNGRGAWRHVHENPLAWEDIELVTRWGHRVEGYSHFVLNDLRAISGIGEDRLRQALVRNEAMPALLADLLDRYDLESATGGAALQPFAQRYKAAQLAGAWNSAGAAPLRASFPGLPTRLVEEIFATATDAECARLKAGKVPLRLAEQARVQLREVRVLRALEALYYDRQEEPNAVRLAMAMLPLTEVWPAGAGLALRADALNGLLVQQVGPESALQSRTLVAAAGEYIAYGADSAELCRTGDIFVALHAIVSDVAPQTSGNIGPQTVRNRLFEAALAHRERLPSALGMEPLQRAFVQPRRQADGRLGYPLSGRQVASWRTGERLRRLYPGASELELRRIRLELGLTVLNAGRVLSELEVQWQVLQVSLQSWVQMPATRVNADGVEEAVRSSSRALAAQRIQAAWRRETTYYDVLRNNDYANGYSLDLSSLEIGPLPAMTARFDHIRSLRLNNMQLAQDPSAFLALFGHVRRLNLYSNRLQSMPGQIAQLRNLVHLDLGRNAIQASAEMFAALRGHPNLRGLSLDSAVPGMPEAALADIASLTRMEHLDLARNALELTSQGWQHLAAMPRLRLLDLGFNQVTLDAQSAQHLSLFGQLRELRLNNNPLRVAPSVRGLTELEILNLADTRIDTWPDGLTELMNPAGRVRLRRVDLSRNGLVEVPELDHTSFVRARNWLLGRVTHRFSINGNPLSEASLNHLRRANMEARSLNSQVAHWLLDCPAPLRERLEQSRLEPDAGQFYLALSRVADTADYRVDPLGMRQRMWAVAKAVLEPPAQEVPIGWSDLRRHIFLLAEDATATCGDGIALLLNQFETSVNLWETASTEGARFVVLESQRVFRLALVDDCAIRIARLRMNRRLALQEQPAGQPLPALDPLDVINDEDLLASVDEAEIRLVLRRAMATRVSLPAQPASMLYTELVSERSLELVQHYIETQATFEAFRGWLQDEVSWQFYMERVEAAQLEVFDQGWALASSFFEEAVSPQGALPSAEGVPAAAFQALQHAAPHLRWLGKRGEALRVQVNSAEYNALYQALADARLSQRRRLLEQAAQVLLEQYCKLPRQVLAK